MSVTIRNLTIVIGGKAIVSHVDLDIADGERVGLIGSSGSGKSMIAKAMMGLLPATAQVSGSIEMGGRRIVGATDADIADLRGRYVGMVFQNPDNQIVQNVVEEDVGFGPENIGVPTKKIWERVEESLKKVGMLHERKSSPNHLSGGQKQRVAIAGILAMHPKCIVLDESTAMLDPVGRREVLDAVKTLNKEEHITILWITHYMEEVTEADKVIVMNKGEIVMEGKPKEIFAEVETLQKYHLDVPQVTLLAHELKKRGMTIPVGITSADELVDVIAKQLGK